jgi:hypothetical protein
MNPKAAKVSGGFEHVITCHYIIAEYFRIGGQTRRLVCAQVHYRVRAGESLIEITRAAQIGDPARARIHRGPHSVQRKNLVVVP